MGLENAISTIEIKQKLQNLKASLPSADESTCEFAKLLADRLNLTLFPEGFNLSCERLLCDLESGVDSYSRQSITNTLAGNPSIVYVLLRRQIPNIAEAVCPKDFADDVKRVYEEVNKRIGR